MIRVLAKPIRTAKSSATLALVSAVALLVPPALRSAEASRTRPPNIIVILSDDQGYADLGVQHQFADLKTPQIDALASQGVRMTAGYDTAPQCSPSRAGLMSGRYQEKFGLDTIPDDPMPLDEVTIPKRLKKAGYVSGMVGKWHLDPNAECVKFARANLPGVEPDAHGRVSIPLNLIRKYSALAQGFDECFQGEINHYFATYDLAGATLDSKGRELNQAGYRLDIQTDAALAFLKRHHEERFFLYVAYYGPHVPLDATAKYLARFPGKMPERRRYALAMLSAIDDGVGRIGAALKQYGISDDTLIVFTSDNGAPLKIKKADEKPLSRPGWDGSLNDPWVGEKGMLAEGGMRVPFIMRWPGHIPAGTTYAQPVITLDIAATAVAAAGLRADDRLDGVNLIPYLSGAEASPPHDALYWRFWDQAAIRQGRWKYIQAGRQGKFLFDVTSDEHEKRNLIKDYPEIARGLVAKLSAWTGRLQPPGDPNRPLNNQERGWYSYYFGLPDD